MLPLNDSRRYYKLGFLPSSDKSVYFQCQLYCQHFPDIGSDNKRSLLSSIQLIVFASEVFRFVDNGVEFKLAFLALSH